MPLTDAAATADGSTPPSSPPEPEVAACQLGGRRHTLSKVRSAQVVSASASPLILAIIDRPRSEPLDLEGSEPLPPMSTLYAFTRAQTDDGEAADFQPRHLADDPGPVRDHFDRRAYERLVAARAACDGAGCLVAGLFGRQTPGTPGSAFGAVVELLDAEGEPQDTVRSLAPPPGRGDSIAACLGVSNEGFLLATAVRPGRGRLLWLDRRATPLDMSYVPGGFDFCSVRADGLRLEVAMSGPEDVIIRSMGGGDEEPAEEPDAGPAPRPAALPGDARVPLMVKAGEVRASVWTDGEAVRAASDGGDPVELLDGGSRWLDAAASSDALVIASVDEQSKVSVVRINAALELEARAEGIVSEADRAWVASGADGAFWLAWLNDSELSVQPLACPADGAAPSDEPRPLATSKSLAAADRRAVSEILSQARTARSRDQNYRAAWLFERAYHLVPANPDTMIESAGLLTEIRYTKSSLRQLERLSNLDDSAARAALRSTCNDRDFERLWSAGEFQRLTGCAAPPEPEPDAGVEEEEGDAAAEPAAAEPAAADNEPASSPAEADDDE